MVECEYYRFRGARTQQNVKEEEELAVQGNRM